ncbi:response regulator transcription factor [Sulfurospirillum sp. 1612]|uniref:response regulator transcription factor n=1 Tax=Sulfurospirillum sp. 1612 TaxID=3094835 RepID=UPI002F93AF3B
MKILLLEDDYILADILFHHLKDDAHQVVHVADGEHALDEASANKFDLMILDINVPKLNGIEVLKSIRSYSKTTPIILITAYQDTKHLKNGFENGCDDYIKKPFDLEELNLRINNIKKRFSIENDDTVVINAHTYMIPSRNLLYVNEQEFQLAKKEIEILLYLSSRKKRVVSSEELMQNIWEFEDMPSDATIRVYIKNLRNIIGKDCIKTIRGSGYYFES